eukprot:GHVT01028063.1.p2 GENE.GHVT01028063.1~~GHVT01028063.1.p2  ORF type:complete len:103 (+),score=29.13 GHVT01028063.1:296-604(+)
MQTVATELGGDAGKEVLGLWEEYEQGSSCESLLVHEIDKLDMMLQAVEYEEGQSVNLNEFLESTSGSIGPSSPFAPLAAAIRELHRDALATRADARETIQGG